MTSQRGITQMRENAEGVLTYFHEAGRAAQAARDVLALAPVVKAAQKFKQEAEYGTEEDADLAYDNLREALAPFEKP